MWSRHGWSFKRDARCFVEPRMDIASVCFCQFANDQESRNADAGILSHFESHIKFMSIPCRMVWLEARGVTGPTTQPPRSGLLRMSWVCRPFHFDMFVLMTTPAKLSLVVCFLVRTTYLKQQDALNRKWTSRTACALLVTLLDWKKEWNGRGM